MTNKLVGAVLVTLMGAAIYVGIAFANQSDQPNYIKPVPYVVTYLGRPLHCLTSEDGSEAGNIGGLTCDFVRYWRSR